MKYTVAFVLAFALVASAVLVLRANLIGDRPHDHETERHANHDNGHKDGHDHSDHGDRAKQPNQADPPGDGVWGGPVKLDLKNRTDPVTGAAVGDDHDAHAHVVFHGHLIHLADENSVRRFRRHPVRYMQQLELEQKLDGSVVKVDAASYRFAPLPDECPFCAMDLSEDSGVYILHRGFKIVFG